MALIADFTEAPLEKLQKPFKDEASTKKQLRDSSWADVRPFKPTNHVIPD